jgi:hypothetical protein
MQFRETNQRLALEQFVMEGGKAGLTFVTYDGLGHWIKTPHEIQDLSVWIEACLPQNPTAVVPEPTSDTPTPMPDSS